MTVTDVTPELRGKIAKGETERRIVAALEPGWRLIGINWKKGGKIRVVNGFGNIKVISLRSVAQ
jgi:hypothetical protein